MKKLLVLISLVLGTTFTAFSQEQNFTRLSNNEIAECKSYDAVAYNFVYNIIFRNYDAAKELMHETIFDVFEDGYSGFVKMMEDGYVHDIVEMRNVIPLGYTPVITISGDRLDLSIFQLNDQFEGMPAVNVRLDCVNARGEFYDDEYGRYDTDVRVMLVCENGVWKVISFK